MDMAFMVGPAYGHVGQFLRPTCLPAREWDLDGELDSKLRETYSARGAHRIHRSDRPPAAALT